MAVDAYVKRTTQLVAELQARSSPQAAIRRALERVGEDVSGILQRAHDTAEQITAQSRREAEDRLEGSRVGSPREVIADAQGRGSRISTSETDRIWAERDRIVEDARGPGSRQLSELAEVAAARFPPAEETGDVPAVDETLPLGTDGRPRASPRRSGSPRRPTTPVTPTRRPTAPACSRRSSSRERDVDAFEAGRAVRAPESEEEPKPGQTEPPTGHHDEPESA